MAERNVTTISKEDMERFQQEATGMIAGPLPGDNDPLTQRRILEQLLFIGRLVIIEGKPDVEVDYVPGCGVVSTAYMLLWRQEIGNG